MAPNVGIDHVSMLLTHGHRSQPALQLVDELTRRYELTIYDPQGDEVIRPADVPTPMDPAALAMIEELRPPDRQKS
ncbi:hypothetical protein ACPPVO_23185 [Dactylosporangium sp. McL0621]|uniref:hypothetical protein n=1 Tax=Dactylosporangium sp. McL0621 TaxID=3415678 RepID=UPI003CF93916